MGIPCVINMPAGPLNFIQEVGLGFYFKDPVASYSNWFGKIVMRQPWKAYAADLVIGNYIGNP
jgi:hypothetical protein